MNMPELGNQTSAGCSMVSWNHVPLEDAGSGKEIAQKIRDGRALLEIVSTPWGVEFYVCDLVMTG
jgi:hypothetical protein